MPDRDAILRALHCRGQDLMIDAPACDQCEYQFQMPNGGGCDFRRLCRDAAELIKNSRLIHTEHAVYTVYEPKEQKFLVDSDGKITPLPVVVRCKDCKHWYFADNRIPSEQENVCGRNGIIVTPDWFCADGECAET